MRTLTWIAILMMTGYCQNAFSQKLSLELISFPVITSNYSSRLIVPHSGVLVSLRHGPMKHLEAGISFRSHSWGSEVSISEAYVYTFVEKDKYSLSNSGRLFLGIPLFYNKLSISTAISNEVILSFKNFQRISFTGGLRFNLNPSYSKISRRYFFGESKFGIRLALWK